VCDIVVKKFTFAISSPDEFLYVMHSTVAPVSSIETKLNAGAQLELKAYLQISNGTKQFLYLNAFMAKWRSQALSF